MKNIVLIIFIVLIIISYKNVYSQPDCYNSSGDSVLLNRQVYQLKLPNYTFLKCCEDKYLPIFDSSLVIEKLTVKDSLKLIYILFNSFLKISNVSFDKPVDFGGSHFKSKVIFNNSYFKGRLGFRYTIFYEPLVFENCYVYEVLDFYGVTFNSNIVFPRLKFEGQNTNLILHDCIINGHIDLYDLTLPDYIDLERCKITKGDLDFTYAKLRPGVEKCYINLLGSDINKIKLDYKLFKLYFPNRDTPPEQKYSVYETLLEKAKRDGFIESAKLIEFDYRELKEYINGNIFSKVKYILNLYWWKFGYNKEYIFLWITILILIFTLISGFFFNKLNESTYSLLNISSENQLKYRKKLYFAFLYTAILFFVFKIDVNKIRSYDIKLFYVLLIYIIGMICTAYFINFVITR